MNNYTIANLAFISIMLAGFYLAYLYGRKTKKFKWSEYAAIIILPTISVLAAAYFVDFKIIIFFTVSALLGFALEYILGLAYHKTINKRLWTYGRLSVQGYTSLLSLPLWGIGGIICWLLSRSLGL